MILEPAGWAPLRPPFRTVSAGLNDAEDLLNGGGRPVNPVRWARLAEAVGHPRACTRAMNHVLDDLRVGLRLSQSVQGVRVVLVGAVDACSDEVRAAQALALLVEAGGWARLKRCRRSDCRRVYPDSTNGCSRTGCRLHSRRSRRAGRTATVLGG